MRAFAPVVWALGLIAVVLQAAALSTQYFQPWLDADYLYPERFAANAVAGGYPLTGWTLTPAPYYFPDLAGAVVGRAVVGVGGAPILPYYVIVACTSLALLAGWSLSRAGRPGWSGWLMGVALVNVLLAWREVGDHARYLWWLVTPGMHGGAVLLGLAQFALWAGPVEEAPVRSRTWTASVLLFVGLLSDPLLFTQFVFPLAVALAATAGPHWWRAARVKVFFRSLVFAIGGLVIWRGLLALTGWWTFSRVIRYAPTPGAVTGAVGRFVRDFANVLWPRAIGFTGLAILATVAFAWLVWRGRKTSGLVTTRQAVWFAGVSLVCTVALPVLTVYWQNAQAARYLLPCLVVPMWGAMAALPKAQVAVSRPNALGGRWPLLGFGAAFLFAGVIGWRGTRAEAWQWPYPATVATLDQFLAKEGRQHGLADFWHAHYLTTVSHTDLRFNQLRPDGSVQFWSNNAFAHYDLLENPRRLVTPHYDFVITNGLNEPAIEARFGAPARRAEVGEYMLWLYDGAGARRLAAEVERVVRAHLKDRPGTELIEAAVVGR